MQDAESQFPNQGSKLHPLQWELRVPTPGRLGKYHLRMHIFTIFFLPMSTGYLSIYFCLFIFLYQVSSSFQCAGPSRPWLNLLLVIFLDAIVSGIFF